MREEGGLIGRGGDKPPKLTKTYNDDREIRTPEAKTKG